MSFWGGRIPFHLAISLAVFAPSAFFLGASFALAARLYVGRGRRVGASTGRLYGLNTLGAILRGDRRDGLADPHARAPSERSSLLAVLQATPGAWRSSAVGGRPEGWRGGPYATAALGRVVALGFGLNEPGSLCSSIYARQEPGKLLALVEGSGAAVTVHQQGPSDRVISINGVNVAGTNPVLRATQKLQAHLPVCLHRSPRSVLQIGFGSGGTCYSVSLHRGDRVDRRGRAQPRRPRGGLRLVRRHQPRRARRPPGASADRRRQELRRGHRTDL